LSLSTKRRCGLGRTGVFLLVLSPTKNKKTAVNDRRFGEIFDRNYFRWK